MGNISAIISLLFFLLMCVYLFWGIYIIRLNRKSSVSKVFLLTCISLSIWSFGFAMANSAQYAGTSLFWRRISAIGWTSIYSLMLHFLLLIANENASIKQKRMFILVHIPALINMYIFSFSNTMAARQYNMVKLDYGWVNQPVNNVWDFLFYTYYGTYIISSLIIAWKWRRKQAGKAIAKKANYFCITIIGAFLLGSVTDVIWNSIFDKPLPQMSPLYVLLPTWAMYYSARHHGLIKPEKPDKKEVIVTVEDKERIFNNLAISFIIGGVLGFFSEYMPFRDNANSDLRAALINATILIGIGLVLNLSQKIKRESLRGTLITIILNLSIPIVIFRFLDFAGITVWIFPIIIIISSLLFTKRVLLVSATITSVITQRLVWILRPEVVVTVNAYDYIARMGVFIVVFLIGSYINKTYIARTRENAYQIELQKINSEISFDFMTINRENFDEKVNKLLFKLGLLFQVERTYMFLIDYEKSTMKYSNEWCNKEISPTIRETEEIPLKNFPWWINQLEKNRMVYINDVNEMPDEASKERDRLIHQKIKSLVAVPIDGKYKIQGFIGIESKSSFKNWSKGDIKFLRILSNLVTTGLTKIKSESEIEFMAYYDHLTNLPNRFLFADRVDQAIHLARKNGKFISVIFIDLDNFKSVNDTMGHSGGDYLIRQVGERLAKKIRERDIVGRFGGDEFVIMLNNITDYSDTVKMANNIMEIFLQPFIINNQEFFITGSAGIANYPVDGEDAEGLIKNADISMYEAKSQGKNRYVVSTLDMRNEVNKEIILSNDLYRAIEKDELIIHYQPQIKLSTGHITGLEALLRWNHPKFGMISPGVFIPLAEKNNLINRIGEWVLREACIQNKKWQDMGLAPLCMAVNLSTIQFMNPNITHTVESVLNETNLNPEYLELEITEGVSIKEKNYVLSILNRFKNIGMSIAIDDFGTEYSSFSRLKVLPVDRIKIDMQFIRGIGENKKDEAITMIIINLAKSLGLNVLAEGVETAQQLEFLKENMCDYVQGYYYYKPMPAEEIEDILEEIAGESDLSFQA